MDNFEATDMLEGAIKDRVECFEKFRSETFVASINCLYKTIIDINNGAYSDDMEDKIIRNFYDLLYSEDGKKYKHLINAEVITSLEEFDVATSNHPIRMAKRQILEAEFNQLWGDFFKKISKERP